MRIFIAAILLAASAAQAQPYPSKPVRIIVPFGPGGSGDTTARTFGHYLETQTRQPVVIDNRAGANGIIGTEAAKTAPPDGYTLLLTTNTAHAANVSLYKQLPYDPLRDFENIGLFGTFGSVAVVPPESGIRSELFRLKAGIALTGVSYKAIGNAVTDLLGGQIQVLFMEYVSGSSHIEGGKLIARGVTGAARHKAWPNVPAINELYPGYELSAYLGLAAPARTLAETVDALHDWLVRSLADAREEYRGFMAQERNRWAEHVRAAGIAPQ